MTGQPLAGLRVLVTRPEPQAATLCSAIEAAGGIAVRFPVMRIAATDPETVADALGQLPEPDIVLFVSGNAARHGPQTLLDSGARIGAIGPTTASALEARGLAVDFLPETVFDSEHLLMHPELQDVAGRQVLIVRGNEGRALLGSVLTERGADVNYVEVYRREPIQPGDRKADAQIETWRDGGIDCVSVMSVATLEYLLDGLPAELREQLRQTPLVAPGDRVIQKASDLLPGTMLIRSAGPRPTDIVNALIDWRHSESNQ